MIRYAMLSIGVLLLASVALGVYLDARIDPPPPQPVVNPHPLGFSDRFVSHDHVVTFHADPLLYDAAGVLAQRGGHPCEWRVYVTYTTAANNGFFRNSNGWWQLVWNGRSVPLYVPSTFIPQP